MVREVLTICVGGCGVRMGSTIWEQYCAEHGFTESGENPNGNVGSRECFFEQTESGQYVPRNLIADVENSTYSAIFHHDFLLSGKKGCGTHLCARSLLRWITDDREPV